MRLGGGALAEPSVVVHAFSPRTQEQKQANLHKGEASLACILSSKSAKVTQGYPVSEQNKNEGTKERERKRKEKQEKKKKDGAFCCKYFLIKKQTK